jgi:tetratricopeptide (TPR) repeat protein
LDTERPSSDADTLEALRRQLRLGRARAVVETLGTAAEHNAATAALIGEARLYLNDPAGAVTLLERARRRSPSDAEVTVLLARARLALGDAHQALALIKPLLTTSGAATSRVWLAYGDVLVALDRLDDACAAYGEAGDRDPHRQRIEAATTALAAGDVRQAEALYRSVLAADGGHIGAICGLALIALGADRPSDADRLLVHALKQSPRVPVIWRTRAQVLIAQGRLEEAQAAGRYLTAIEPASAQSWITVAAAAARSLQQEAALIAYRRAAQLRPSEVRLQTSLGHVHKALGQRAESEAAYHSALALDPLDGEAWWSLADLKNYRFTDAEVIQLAQLLTAPSPSVHEAQWAFAYGKALEQRGDHAAAFASYARGNARRREDSPFDADGFEAHCERVIAAFSADFFATRTGVGDPRPGPIFIVGLPRSGSTLLEQILASHPAVEGTMELQTVPAIVRDLELRSPNGGGYPDAIQGLTPADWATLGRRYLTETTVLHPNRPYFTDKLPNNWLHVGLIAAMLPGALLIDARRQPMDACYSAFRQHFAEGQTFTYDLTDLGRYYRAYLGVMAHWNAVLPGRVLTVHYEAVVGDPDAEIRRVLAHCGLPYDPRCLRFHETRRTVRTASAEQVRQPIYTSGVGYWRQVAAELAPLKDALGAAAEDQDPCP